MKTGTLMSITMMMTLCAWLAAPVRLGAQEHKAGDTRISDKDGQPYVWIPPGQFSMGCSPGDGECGSKENPVHQVTITKGFWMGQTPVTQTAYQRVTGQNPSSFKGPYLPVENVTWIEAKQYCGKVGMRLPTEAEYEYAARAGSTASRYGDIDQIAWHKRNSGGKTHGVGDKLPNAWNLYDMLGNVWEWTADWYGGYPAGAQSDPTGPASGNWRVLRGGSWNRDPRFVRASVRDRNVPEFRNYDIGVRCVGN
jgi:formylglycine-generating enzyme required for sulfatase activity